MSIFINNNYAKLTSQKILDDIDKLGEIIENENDIDMTSIIEKYKLYLYKYFDITSSKYEIYITNGYKSYNLIFNLITLYFNTKIHIIIANTDENSTLNYCKKLITNKQIEITILYPNKNGIIDIENIKNNIKNNTKLLSIPYSNKELGSKNNIKEINNLCKENNIIYTSNINSLFGYNNIKCVKNIDIIFSTFDNIYGPSNISLLLIKKKLINEKIHNYIKKSNILLNKKKNLPLISGSLSSLLNVLKNRDDKNNKIKLLKDTFIDKLNKFFPILTFLEYNNIYDQSIIKLTIIIINIEKTNTILLSIFSNKIKINNNNIKKYLEQKDIYTNDLSSIIFDNIEYDNRIKNGLLSLSFGDHNKQTEINKIIKSLIEAIKLQYDGLLNEINDNIIVKQKLIQKKIKKIVKFSNPICISSKSKIHNYPKIKSILIK